MNSLDFMQAISQVDPKIVQEALDQMENNTKRKHSKKIMRTVLIAAVVTALLCGAAWAAVYFGTQLNPVEAGDVVAGTWAGQSVTYENAQMFLTFDIQGDCRLAQFRADWLPSEPNWDSRDGEGWTNYLADEGKGESLPYSVNVYSGAMLRGVRCTLNGAVEIVGQDDWKGFQRTRLHVDYSAEEPHVWDAANYILLFQPEDNYLIYIAGTSGMAVLEEIAENMEFRTGDVDTYEPDPAYATDVCWFDLGRG